MFAGLGNSRSTGARGKVVTLGLAVGFWLATCGSSGDTSQPDDMETLTTGPVESELPENETGTP